MLLKPITIFVLLALTFSSMACQEDDSGAKAPVKDRGTPVLVAPSFDTAPLTYAEEGVLYSFTPRASGQPTPTISMSGFPAWLSWNGATLSGTPSAADVSASTLIEMRASNGVENDAVLNFSIAVAASSMGGGGGGGSGQPDIAPAITSTANWSAQENVPYQYVITATGSPAPTITVSNLPAWLSRTGDTLSGTPPPGSAGWTGTIRVEAENGVDPVAVEQFAIKVDPIPPAPTMALSGPAFVNEGTAAGGAAFRVTLYNAPNGTSATVDYYTRAGSAGPNAEYYESSGTATILPGKDFVTIGVFFKDDDADEQDKTFDLVIENPSIGSITLDTWSVTIRDDDAPSELSVARKDWQKEPASGSVNASFDVEMDKSSYYQVSVD